MRFCLYSLLTPYWDCLITQNLLLKLSCFFSLNIKGCIVCQKWMPFYNLSADLTAAFVEHPDASIPSQCASKDDRGSQFIWASDDQWCTIHLSLVSWVGPHPASARCFAFFSHFLLNCEHSAISNLCSVKIWRWFVYFSMQVNSLSVFKY